MSTKSFEQFVMEQPEGRTISHANWATCAYGDYVREELGESFSSEFRDEHFYTGSKLSKTENVKAIIGDEVLFEALNQKSDLPTYGSLQRFLKNKDQRS